MQIPMRVFAALAAAALVVVGAYYFLTSGQPAYVVALGQPIRQDDFLYTVVGVSKAKSIGALENRAVAHGIFYIATVEVANKAQRVGYRWDPSIVYVIDAAGRKFQPSLDAQRALDAARPHGEFVEAGESVRFQVAFDLPERVDRPSLAFSNGILMGDMFNGAAYMKARVPLE